MTPQDTPGGGRPYYQDDWLTVYHGDCKDVMAGMEPESVHCVVTSPPYWGLRDYGSPGQLGLERTPEEYVANLVAVFREVRRVLRADGTVWLNLGDSYANTGGMTGGTAGKDGGAARKARMFEGGYRALSPGLKPKDLVGIPWRVAFALQADGWYLRSDIIWAKPNPMPESVTDRPTKSHEYIFLLSKSPRYYFDADAVREPHESAMEQWRQTHGRLEGQGPKAIDGRSSGNGTANRRGMGDPAGRNIRSVWTMATQPYPGAHFATFPESLPERCIKAGTSEKGVCPACGAPWHRVTETTRSAAPVVPMTEKAHARAEGNGEYRPNSEETGGVSGLVSVRTLSWIPSCTHGREPIGGLVLDPFAGSGTTGMVAQSLSRRAVLIDLSLDYLDQLMARNADIPLGLGA
jgi:DNA modification methylase